MQNKKKLAIFDFCETLVNFQTADNFIHFVREKKDSNSMEIKEFLRKSLNKAKIIRALEIAGIKSLNKKIVLWQLRGIGKKELEKYSKEYYNKKIKPSFVKDIISKMEELKSEGYKVYVASGGYEIYLKHFIKEFKLNGLVCTKILFREKKCLGRFNGLDCLGKNKIKLLNNLFVNKKIKEYDSISYSDSITDLPLLKSTNKGIIVSKNKPANWGKKYGLGDLIWAS